MSTTHNASLARIPGETEEALIVWDQTPTVGDRIIADDPRGAFEFDVEQIHPSHLGQFVSGRDLEGVVCVALFHVGATL